MMSCINNSHCLQENRCISGFCLCSSEYLSNKDHKIINEALILPMIEAILHDLSRLRYIYVLIFILLALLGLINNIFALMTFIRDRIRYTVCGVYLITYSICSTILMLSLLTIPLIAIYYNDCLVRLWTCHGHPYISMVTVYTGILTSAALAIEGVLNTRFNYPKLRSRKKALIISLSILGFVAISNLDKVFARHMLTNQSGHYFCAYKKSSYQYWSKVLFYLYTVIPSLIHLICTICILSKKQAKENCIQRICIHQIYFIPSIFIAACLISNDFSHYVFHFYGAYASKYTVRLSIGFLFLLYAPQILTYFIYVMPNEFYVKEFYQIWFYRKLCCCFYNKQRHIQEFEMISRLWQRRTSLENSRTIANLDDICVDTEFYK